MGTGLARAQANLENPAPGSHQSGIGLVSGWSCTRPDGVEIDGVLHPVAYGTPRADVVLAGACPRADVGFGLLVGWGNFGAGQHRAQLKIGGAPAGPAADFEIPAISREFRRGLAREVTVADFPQPGQTTTLVWQEAQQNFAIKGTSGNTPGPIRDIIHTRLVVDLATRTATATIDVAAAAPGARSVFEAAGLEIRRVSQDGTAVPWTVTNGKLEVTLPAGSEVPARIVIDYAFQVHDRFDGLLPSASTFVWPYFCGNLFPCHSDPADGSSFELAIAGTPPGLTTIHAAHIDTAPAYQLAWATGDYRRLDLGVTANGTRLVAHYLPGGEDDAAVGTAQLRQVMSWYELNYGAYPFGQEAGAVAVAWNGGYGGMEHHPYWHVATAAMRDPLVHAHEAAHGWIGAGVRIACWEDFALSEGTASYLAARALEEVAGAAEGERIWANYRGRLQAAMDGPGPKLAWPDGCGRIDILKDGLFTDIPYLKGAFFWRALELRIGRGAVDAALRDFFRRYRHQAASFSDALASVARSSGYDAAACARDWLKREIVPAAAACP
jgi:aminopeptidase N